MTVLFDVVLVGFPDGTKTGGTPAEALSQVFGVPKDQAEKVVARMPTAIRKGVSEGDFRKFNGAFLFMGAVGEFRPASGDGAPLALGRPAAPPPAAPKVPEPVVTASVPSVRVSEPSGASELARIELSKARVDQVSGAVIGVRSSGSAPIVERSRVSGAPLVVEGSSGFLDEELDALPSGDGWAEAPASEEPAAPLQGMPLSSDALEGLVPAGGLSLSATQPLDYGRDTIASRAQPAPESVAMPQPVLGGSVGGRQVIETGSVPHSPSILAFFGEDGSPQPKPTPAAAPAPSFADLDAVDAMAQSLFGGAPESKAQVDAMAQSLFGGAPESKASSPDEILFGDPLDFALGPLGVSLSAGAVEPEPVATPAVQVRSPWSRGSGSAAALISNNLPAAAPASPSRVTGAPAAVPADSAEASRVPGLGGALDVFSGSFQAGAAPEEAPARPEQAAAWRPDPTSESGQRAPLALSPDSSDAAAALPRRPAPVAKSAARKGPLDDKSFNESIAYCLTLPLQHSGFFWIGFGALFGLLGYLGVGVAHIMPVAGLPLMLLGLFGTVAYGFGTFDACMRATLAGDKDVDAPPAVGAIVPFLLNATPLVACAMLLGGASLGWLGTKSSPDHSGAGMTLAATCILAAPLAYWPMALAYAVRKGSPTGVFAFGTVIGRIVAVLSNYLVVVFLGGVSLLIVFAGLSEVLGSISFALLKVMGGLVAGAAVTAAHGVMGALMGKVLHDDPSLFER